MRFEVKEATSRMIRRQVRIENARDLLFGRAKGMPGERWWARPLVARDMLHWYMPSKYGLPEFQLDQYYQMQAERFKKREVKPWVAMFKETAERIQANKASLKEWMEKEGNRLSNESSSVDDLNAVLRMLEGSEDDSALSLRPSEGASDSKIIQMALLRERHRRRHERVKLNPRTLFINKRHRFVDPLFRRRRLKWMERFLAGMNNAKEIKYNRHFTRHPDLQDKWPSNLGSVTVKWPNRRN